MMKVVGSFAVMALWLISLTLRAMPLLDLVTPEGTRKNQLVGYGLVVGLQGSGDQTRQTQFTAQSVNNLLRQFGVQLPENAEPRLKNVAAVSVHTTLNTYVRPGQALDVVVSSIGDAKSLRGGSLLATPLKGLDGNVYAIAQGSLVVGGVTAEGASGSKATVNITTVGRIPGGAVVERSVIPLFDDYGHIMLNLNETGFRQARLIVNAIDREFGQGTAHAIDAARVAVSAPYDTDQRVAFMSRLESLTIPQVELPARVVINPRTGTVVIGQNVRIRPVAVSHGSLVVTVSEEPQVSQPGMFSRGQTTTVPRSEVQISEQKGTIYELPDSPRLSDVVSALNSVGATPSELMSILQAFRQAGALEAEIDVL